MNDYFGVAQLWAQGASRPLAHRPFRAVSRDPGLKARVSAPLWEGGKLPPKAFTQSGLKAGSG